MSHVVGDGVFLLPDDIRDEVLSPEHFVACDFKVVGFGIVNGDPHRAFVIEGISAYVDSSFDVREPFRAVFGIRVLLEVPFSVVGWVHECQACTPAELVREMRVSGEIVFVHEDILWCLVTGGFLA